MALTELRTFGSRLRALRSSKQVSQAELARLIGRHQSTIGPYERDEYMPARDIVERLASALDSSPEYLLFGRSPQRPSVPVLGRLTAAGTIESGSNAMISGQIALPHDRVVALLVTDDSMHPAFSQGDMALAESVRSGDISAAIGSAVLAELQDGRAFLRTLLPAAETGRYDLAAFNAPTWHSVAVTGIRKCIGRLVRDSWSD